MYVKRPKEKAGYIIELTPKEKTSKPKAEEEPPAKPEEETGEPKAETVTKPAKRKRTKTATLEEPIEEKESTKEEEKDATTQTDEIPPES